MRNSLTFFLLPLYLYVWEEKKYTLRKRNKMQTTEQNQSDTTSEIKKKSLNAKCVVTGIYGLRNKTNGKWYIGQSADNIHIRWGRYKRHECKAQIKLYNALKKYGYDNFDKVILEECEPIKELLTSKETHWVEFYNSIESGYNIAVPANGPMEGRHHTIKSRNKISNSLIGNANASGTIWSEERKEHHRKMHLGKTMSVESIEKTRTWLLGSCWITDGISNKKYEKSKEIPLGWRRGLTTKCPRGKDGKFIKSQINSSRF